MVVTIYSNDKALNWGATGEERIVQNVLNILRTRHYEVPFMRGLGVNADFIDSEHNKVKSELVAHVTEVINTYEPRATVLDVSILSVDENGDYVYSVELEV